MAKKTTKVQTKKVKKKKGVTGTLPLGVAVDLFKKKKKDEMKKKKK
jgi:hypothetical protein